MRPSVDKMIEIENKAAAGLERVHLIRNPGQTVLLFEELDLSFSTADMTLIEESWKKGVSVPDLAFRLNRDENEVFLAIFHLSLKNRTNSKDPIRMTVNQIRGGE